MRCLVTVLFPFPGSHLPVPFATGHWNWPLWNFAVGWVVATAKARKILLLSTGCKEKWYTLEQRLSWIKLGCTWDQRVPWECHPSRALKQSPTWYVCRLASTSLLAQPLYQVWIWAFLKGIMVVAYKHIKRRLVSKLLMGAFSWRPWIPGTLKFDAILSQFRCMVHRFFFEGFMFSSDVTPSWPISMEQM